MPDTSYLNNKLDSLNSKLDLFLKSVKTEHHENIKQEPMIGWLILLVFIAASVIFLMRTIKKKKFGEEDTNNIIWAIIWCGILGLLFFALFEFGLLNPPDNGFLISHA